MRAVRLNATVVNHRHLAIQSLRALYGVRSTEYICTNVKRVRVHTPKTPFRDQTGGEGTSPGLESKVPSSSGFGIIWVDWTIPIEKRWLGFPLRMAFQRSMHGWGWGWGAFAHAPTNTSLLLYRPKLPSTSKECKYAQVPCLPTGTLRRDNLKPFGRCSLGGCSQVEKVRKVVVDNASRQGSERVPTRLVGGRVVAACLYCCIGWLARFRRRRTVCGVWVYSV